VVDPHNAKEAWLNQGFLGNNFSGGMIMTFPFRLRSRSQAVAPGSRFVTASLRERTNERLTERRKSRSFRGRFRALLLDTNGNTPVESALVIVVIFTPLVLGLFSCSMALVSYQQLGYATMTATQTLANGRGVLTDPCKTAASAVTSNLSSWNQANFTYTVTITSTVDAVNTTTSYGPYTGTANATCTAAASSLTNAVGGTNGNPVTLHMTYVYSWFPIFGRHITGNLAAEDTMLVS